MNTLMVLLEISDVIGLDDALNRTANLVPAASTVVVSLYVRTEPVRLRFGVKSMPLLMEMRGPRVAPEAVIVNLELMIVIEPTRLIREPSSASEITSQLSRVKWLYSPPLLEMSDTVSVELE